MLKLPTHQLAYSQAMLATFLSSLLFFLQSVWQVEGMPMLASEARGERGELGHNVSPYMLLRSLVTLFLI